MSKITSKTKTGKKYLRLPIDDKTQQLIDEIISENPFFTPLDAIRFILGKHIQKSNKQKMLAWLKKNVKDKNLPAMSEDEIFEIIEKNGLARANE